MGWDRKFDFCCVSYTVVIDGYYQLAQDTEYVKHELNEVYCSITYDEL